MKANKFLALIFGALIVIGFISLNSLFSGEQRIHTIFLAIGLILGSLFVEFKFANRRKKNLLFLIIEIILDVLAGLGASIVLTPIIVFLLPNLVGVLSSDAVAAIATVWLATCVDI